MSITQHDLSQFNEFAATRLSTDGAQSMVELASQWEAQRAQYDDTVAQLTDCIADMEAGHGRPLREFAEEMRVKYDIPNDDA